MLWITLRFILPHGPTNPLELIRAEGGSPLFNLNQLLHKRDHSKWSNLVLCDEQWSRGGIRGQEKTICVCELPVGQEIRGPGFAQMSLRRPFGSNQSSSGVLSIRISLTP